MNNAEFITAAVGFAREAHRIDLNDAADILTEVAVLLNSDIPDVDNSPMMIKLWRRVGRQYDPHARHQIAMRKLPTLKQLHDEWNSLVPLAHALGIDDVQIHTSLHERRRDGISHVLGLRQRIALKQLSLLDGEDR